MTLKVADVGGFNSLLIVCKRQQTMQTIDRKTWPYGVIVCANKQTIAQTVKPAWIKAKTPIFLIVCQFATDTHTQAILPIFCLISACVGGYANY